MPVALAKKVVKIDRTLCRNRLNGLKPILKEVAKGEIDTLYITVLRKDRYQRFYWFGDSISALGLLERSITRVNQYIDDEREN